MNLEKKIQGRTAVVGVIGLGYVGLPLMHAFHHAGFPVLGFDVDPDKVELARRCGADAAMRRDDAALEDTIDFLTGGVGADAVYIAFIVYPSDAGDVGSHRHQPRVCSGSSVHSAGDVRDHAGGAVTGPRLNIRPLALWPSIVMTLRP